MISPRTQEKLTVSLGSAEFGHFRIASTIFDEAHVLAPFL